MRTRLLRALVLPAALAVGFAAVSCGGGGSGPGPMVLVGFNLPNVAGVNLDYPLIYTFSDDVDPVSVTPDTIQVTGPAGFGFTFEALVVDGNLVAELPRLPRFDDYSDGGMFAGKTYNVFLPIFPAVDTVRSTTGKPLVKAESFSFSTTPTVTFIEPSRPLSHTPGPISGPNLRGDEDGCLNNPNNELYAFPGFQFGTNANARLLCLKNEGPPHVLNAESSPTFDQRAVGTPSAVQPGLLDMPAVQVHFNEPVDPVTATPYVPTTQLSVNVQLWRVGDTDANPLAVPEQIKTNKPVVVQDLSSTEVILVAVGPQKQGTYLINIQGVKDLPGNAVVTTDRPSPGAAAPNGYASIEPALVGKVAPGYRIYFRSLELGTLPGSITENFGENFDEQRNHLFTLTTTPTLPSVSIPLSPATGNVGFTLIQTQPGQATNANWNGTRTFAGIAGAAVNVNQDDGTGRLKAVYEPFLGNGQDGALHVTATGNTLFSTGGVNGNGLYEFESVLIDAGGTLKLSGSTPVVMLCRGSFTVNGKIDASGGTGGFGIDTDGGVAYFHYNDTIDPGHTMPLSDSIPSSGLGGLAGPGGGDGGHGAPTSSGVSAAGAGGSATDRWSGAFITGKGAAGANGDTTNQGGGGAGYGTAGSGGSGAANGAAYGAADFGRALALFTPDRNYEPNTGVIAGSGGGGGGAQDDSVTNGGTSSAVESTMGDGSYPMLAGGQETGADDCGGGGGGGGGGLWVMADTITIASGAVVTANGGRGGNTYAKADQTIVVTPPSSMSPGGSTVTGVNDPNAAGTGKGGGGGGGSGGAILLQARGSFTAAAGSSITAVGGVGGTTGGGSKNGGAGGSGRIGLMSFKASGESAAGSFSSLGTVTPAAGSSGAIWQPTTDLTSQGVSLWFDQVTVSATYSQPAFDDDNFNTLTGPPYNLVRGLANDFEAIVEYQGADDLQPSGDVQNATSGTGITAWSSTLTSINTKRFFRFRWRFFCKHGYPQSTAPMPAVLDFTIPFQK